MKGALNKTMISAMILALNTVLDDILVILRTILTIAESDKENYKELMELTRKVREKVYTAERMAFRIYDVLTM